MERRYKKLGIGWSKAASGFTLIEMVVVVALLFMVLGVSIPMLAGNFGNLSLKSTAREISSFCRIARTYAISTKDVHRIVFKPETGIYRIEGSGVAGKYSGARELPERIEVKGDCGGGSEDIYASEDYDGVVVYGSDTFVPEILYEDFEIIFYPGGYSSGGCLSLTNDKSGILIRCEPITGRIICGNIRPL